MGWKPLSTDVKRIEASGKTRKSIDPPKLTVNRPWRIGNSSITSKEMSWVERNWDANQSQVRNKYPDASGSQIEGQVKQFRKKSQI